MATSDTSDNEGDLLEAARKDILRRITEQARMGAGKEYGADGVRCLAEAYAWLLSPAQPHGGSVRVGK